MLNGAQEAMRWLPYLDTRNFVHSGSRFIRSVSSCMSVGMSLPNVVCNALPCVQCWPWVYMLRQFEADICYMMCIRYKLYTMSMIIAALESAYSSFLTLLDELWLQLVDRFDYLRNTLRVQLAPPWLSFGCW